MAVPSAATYIGAMPSHRAARTRSRRSAPTDPAARARLNTVYMVLTFAGGAAGTLLGVTAWHSAGWTGVGITGLVLLAAAAAIVGTSLWSKK